MPPRGGNGAHLALQLHHTGLGAEQCCLPARHILIDLCSWSSWPPLVQGALGWELSLWKQREKTKTLRIRSFAAWPSVPEGKNLASPAAVGQPEGVPWGWEPAETHGCCQGGKAWLWGESIPYDSSSTLLQPKPVAVLGLLSPGKCSSPHPDTSTPGSSLLGAEFGCCTSRYGLTRPT